MTTLIPIQSAAMWYVDQVRAESGVGARSGFHSGLADKSSVTSTKSLVATAGVCIICARIVADGSAPVEKMRIPDRKQNVPDKVFGVRATFT